MASHLQLICVSLSTSLATGGNALARECLVYIGTYTGKESEGIYVYRFDPATGKSGPVELAATTGNPSFLAIDPQARFLYAVNEVDTFQNQPTGAVSVFAINRESGKLRLLQQISSLGACPAHLSLDRSARYLMVANYNGGNAAVFPVGNDGQLGPHSAFIQNAGSSIDPLRQAGPHAHFIRVTSDNRLAIIADLGLDKLLLYRFDARTGSLTPGDPGFVLMDPGAGPRHLAFAPSGKFVYVVNELTCTVTVLEYEADPGMLHVRQTISTLPENFTGKNTAAEIVVDAKGRFLYVSNRGDDSIVQFSIDPGNGSLTRVASFPCGGKKPRNFAIDPTGQWLFVANRDSGNIKLFRIEPDSGRLIPASQPVKIVSPVCVRFITTK